MQFWQSILPKPEDLTIFSDLTPFMESHAFKIISLSLVVIYMGWLFFMAYTDRFEPQKTE